ncbi:MAG: hypothetical protein LBG43_02420 [Treponema sp.]|nr:hypothetical protein [Treponema sp.]
MPYLRQTASLENRKRVGSVAVVMDFVNVDGKQSVLGRYLTEDSMKRLVTIAM